jgi:ATP-binding cassette subfamily F protein 3
MDELAEKTLEVGGRSLQMHWGNYEDYLRAKPEETVTEEAKPSRERKPSTERGVPKTTASKNQARRLRQKLDELEESIAETETAKASLEGRMSVPGFYDNPDEANAIVETHRSLEDKLEKLYEEWETLAKKQEET